MFRNTFAVELLKKCQLGARSNVAGGRPGDRETALLPLGDRFAGTVGKTVKCTWDSPEDPIILQNVDEVCAERQNELRTSS